MAKKLKKDILGFTKAGVGLGVGVGITSSLPPTGVAGFSPSAGLASMGGMMPMVSTTMMGGHALRMVGKLQPKKKRRSKR